MRTRVIGAHSGRVDFHVLAIALLVPERYEGGFSGFLSLMLYLLIPWSAVNLVDYYWVRHGKYSVVDMFSRTSLYGKWAWRGLFSYAAGLLAMAPFFVLPFYVGPGARALKGVDISILFGLPVAGLAYYYLARSLDLRPEEKAYETSLAALEPSTVRPDLISSMKTGELHRSSACAQLPG